MLNYLLLFFVATVACEQKPNFVVVITDDQDSVLDGMKPMKNVRRFIGDEGVTFVNSYTTSPICCPSRASFLTGKYIHNHNTKNNSLAGGCYGSQWRRQHESHTFATILQDAEYNTFYAGKYLNQYGVREAGGSSRVPNGWSEWHGLVGNSVYYDYTISNNGVPTHSTDEYLTDVIRNLAVSYIENQTETQPFLMVLAPPAPHQPFTPAPRHKGKFANVTAVRHDNFNVPAMDKHWLLQMPPSPLPDSILPQLDEVFRSRWEALLAVDEMVADVVGALDNGAMLENTYLIYTSDNGYHIGQFSQVYDKRQPYETDIKVPLLIRGPNVPKNLTSETPVLNIDIAPTILELAGINVPDKMDGRPISIGDSALKERSMLIEYYGEGSDHTVDDACPWKYDAGQLSECYPQYDCKCQDSRNNTYACIRHIAERINKKYCLFYDNASDNFTKQYNLSIYRNESIPTFVEMYNLSKDPYELNNIIDSVLPAIKHWYRLMVIQMLNCSGADCNDPIGGDDAVDQKTWFRIQKKEVIPI